MKIVQTKKMPSTNGHYSQCIEHNGLLYISGQLPIEHLTKKIPDGIVEQTILVLRKIELIVNEAGSPINHIIQMRIYISDIELWDEVNDIYSDFFGQHKPVRCIVPTKRLHYGCLIEVEAIAYK